MWGQDFPRKAVPVKTHYPLITPTPDPLTTQYLCNFISRVLCSSCHLIPGPWRGQSHWFWQTAGWPEGRFEPLNLCAQSSSPPDTSSPSTPGASGWRCSPLIRCPCEDRHQEKRSTIFNTLFRRQRSRLQSHFPSITLNWIKEKKMDGWFFLIQIVKYRMLHKHCFLILGA